MDWNEVLDLFKKAGRHFNLGFTRQNGWIYLSIDGKKIEIKRSDFKVLRPMKEKEAGVKKSLNITVW